jgi:glycosyltransferase involved in cell wall biosynthesis
VAVPGPLDPQVAVVIPTHGRPAALQRLLDAISRQELARDRFEVIVVDDGSPEPVRPAPGGLALTVVRHERSQGPAAARNAGWRVARAPTIAFVDDDCVPAPGWLSALLAASGPDVVVQGAVAPALSPGVREPRPLEHTISVGGPTPLFVSANIAYPRRLLERLGGFDESYRRASGEDADLGARAVASGAPTVFAPDALVHHDVVTRTLGQHLRHTLKWTDGVRALAAHPQLRGLLVARVFWKPTHPWLLGALLALGARRPGLALVAMLPWVRHYRRRYAEYPDEMVRALPAHLVIDLTEIGVVVAGSLRHRTVML